MKLDATLLDKLANSVVSRAMESDERSLCEREQALGDKLYFAAFPQELQEKMHTLPDWFFVTRNRLYIVLESEKTIYMTIYMSEARIFPVSGYSYLGGVESHFKRGDDLYDEIKEFHDAYESYLHKKVELQNKILNILSRYHTVESLCKDWGDIVSTLPSICIQSDLQQTAWRAYTTSNKKCSPPIKSCRICGMLDPEGDNVCPLKGEVSEDFVCDHWVKRV